MEPELVKELARSRGDSIRVGMEPDLEKEWTQSLDGARTGVGGSHE